MKVGLDCNFQPRRVKIKFPMRAAIFFNFEKD